jgi:excisionase family DNA binding protein
MQNPFEQIEDRLGKIENLLLDLRSDQHTAGTAKNEKDLLTVHEAAEFLTLAVPTIYSMVSRGTLPFMKRSKRIYFSRIELVEFLKAGRRQTTAEMAANADEFIPKRKRR